MMPLGSKLALPQGSQVGTQDCRPLLLSNQVSDKGPSWSSCFVGLSLSKTLQRPSLVLVKPRKNMPYGDVVGYNALWRCSKPPFNSVPNNKMLDITKLKAFADDKLNIAKMTISLYDRVENTVGKGENAGYQHFLLFP